MDDPFMLGLALRDPLLNLQEVFHFLESHPFTESNELRALCVPLYAAESRPSTEFGRLSRVLAAASLRRNPILWSLISAAWPWDIMVAYWLNQRREALVTWLPRWLDVWFELEALGALANYAYLHPDATFPEWLPEGDTPLFEARQLGHPLLPDDIRICNDFSLNEPGDLALITGSNMSGKSTFLRTIGINVCLALAGGPVVAQRLRTVPLRLFTVIRVTDSLADGLSYFYAEVKRLRALLALLEDDSGPILYLIDEIFRGTNNRERLIGSRAYIRAVTRHQGVGVLSTHDLELVHLAEEIPQIHNYHFTETISNGRMHFAYDLRPGPCPSTNALLIMQMEGLPVHEIP